MASRKVPRDKFFEKVINPYLVGVLQHPQSIEMHEGVLHISDVEGPKKTESVEARLEAMEQQVFKCQGMVERGLNANHMMITEFTNKHKIDANDIGKHLSKLYDRIDHLQAQIYDLQNQNCEVMDLIVKTVRRTVADQKRYCGYEPYIRMLINANIGMHAYQIDRPHLLLESEFEDNEVVMDPSHPSSATTRQ
ncbi:40S ribosomal protein S5-1 [Hordeum vulgare]|nr:40S ribosomal protein S5-1 [Hordeum vulgare]